MFVRSETPPTVSRPLNVFLLSDGRSTVNDRLDNDAFIREVAKLRQGHVSINSFSAGSNANRFLLDLLAYSNRGASLHEETVPKFAPELVNFIRTHSELIVADLRYRATGVLAKESYPKQLPHLYRGKTLSLYGRYDEGVDTVGMQLIGRDADGKDQELVFRGNLKTAPRTGPQLAADWAAQKVFFLLVERVMTPTPEITAEIRKLAERYKLLVPYL
jgi:Ca-activated chloride channel family protein